MFSHFHLFDLRAWMETGGPTTPAICGGATTNLTAGETGYAGTGLVCTFRILLLSQHGQGLCFQITYVSGYLPAIAWNRPWGGWRDGSLETWRPPRFILPIKGGVKGAILAGDFCLPQPCVGMTARHAHIGIAIPLGNPLPRPSVPPSCPRLSTMCV